MEHQSFTIITDRVFMHSVDECYPENYIGIQDTIVLINMGYYFMKTNFNIILM